MALTHKFAADRPGSPFDKDGDNFRMRAGGRGVLSAAEIEALLRPDIPADAFEEPEEVSAYIGPDLSGGGVGSDDKLLQEAGALAARLTLSLRRTCQVPAIVTVKAAQYSPLSHLVSQHHGEPVLVLFAGEGGALVAGLTLDIKLALTIIDRVCGGQETAPVPIRKLSQLDKSILEDVLAPLAKALDPSFSIACIEANRSAGHALLPPGKAKLAELSCQIGAVNGKAAFARLLPVADNRGQSIGQLGQTTPNMGRVMTSLTVRIASLSVPVSQLSNLKAGSVLLLGLPTDQPAELLSGGYQGDIVAEGEIGRKGDKVAVRITACKPVF